MKGLHTPYRATVFFNYLKNLKGIDVSDDSWKNDSTDSFSFLDLKIMLPNTSVDADWYQFNVFPDEYYGTQEMEDNLLQFDDVRQLAEYLERYELKKQIETKINDDEILDFCNEVIERSILIGIFESERQFDNWAELANFGSETEVLVGILSKL